MEKSDVLIIGGGPAGLNAALYAARKELKTILISEDTGGQMLLTNEIENYLGVPSVSGFELAEKFEAHVRMYPVEFRNARVESLRKTGKGDFEARTDDGKVYFGKTCIAAAGRRSRQLGIPGEAEYAGRGVSYCATCDGPLYRGKTTAIVGGGDSAVQAAMEMAKLCPQVYLIVRSRIRAQEILTARMEKMENIRVYLGYSPVCIAGEKKVTSLRIAQAGSGTQTELAVDGVFVEAGGLPNTGYLPKETEMNDQGEVISDKDGKTNIPGLFAAGDATNRTNKQIIIAAGEGAAAALAAHEYILRGNQ